MKQYNNAVHDNLSMMTFGQSLIAININKKIYGKQFLLFKKPIYSMLLW